MSIAFLWGVATSAHAQITSTSRPWNPLTDMTVIAEAVETERHKEGDVKTTTLRLYSVMREGRVIDLPSESFETVRHAQRDFELFPGKHVLKLRRGTSGGEWYIERSSHGEIVDGAERQRQADMVDLREEWAWSGHDITRELCFQKIKQAYDAEEFLFEFRLDDAAKCQKYKSEFDHLYRRAR